MYRTRVQINSSFWLSSAIQKISYDTVDNPLGISFACLRDREDFFGDELFHFHLFGFIRKIEFLARALISLHNNLYFLWPEVAAVLEIDRSAQMAPNWQK